MLSKGYVSQEEIIETSNRLVEIRNFIACLINEIHVILRK